SGSSRRESPPRKMTRSRAVNPRLATRLAPKPALLYVNSIPLAALSCSLNGSLISGGAVLHILGPPSGEAFKPNGVRSSSLKGTLSLKGPFPLLGSKSPAALFHSFSLGRSPPNQTAKWKASIAETSMTGTSGFLFLAHSSHLLFSTLFPP